MVEIRKGVKFLHVTAIPRSLRFLHGQIGYLKVRGIEVHAVSSPGKELEGFGAREGIQVHSVRILRGITPLRDLGTIITLWLKLMWLRPKIVHAHMTKAGLLGMIAGRLAGIPICIYQNHGMAWLSERGITRAMLRWCEKISCRVAHQVLFVSHSVHDIAVREKLCSAGKSRVLVRGSINGVDAENLFNPERLTHDERRRVRGLYGIPSGALVVGFVGRIFKVKGIDYLAAAWKVLREEILTLHLLVVGIYDQRDPVMRETEGFLRFDQRVHMTGWTNEPVPYYTAMDVLVLPSLHEGLPVTLLEGAAMKLPIVATSIPGNIDAVVDGVTGTLVPPQDPVALTDAIRMYLNDPELRRRHGEAGRNRVLKDFRQETIWKAMYEEYARLLRQKGIRVPQSDAVNMSEPSIVGN